MSRIVRLRRIASTSALAALTLLLPACKEPTLQAFGQLQSERIELAAESAEPISSITASEGDSVAAQVVLLTQESARIDARLASMTAEIARVSAALDEQRVGPRRETIAVARARLDAALVDLELGEKTLARLEALEARGLTSAESVDVASRSFAATRAQVELARAQLLELEAGVREEQIAQTLAQIASLQGQRALLEIEKTRLDSHAPVPALVDALPFEVGERPRIGDVLAVLLIGEQPLARIYIPEQVRARIQIGTTLDVAVDGVGARIPARVLRIESDATFTPYFALSEQDRGRLSYVAELSLDYSGPRLPEGIPVQVDLASFVLTGQSK